MDEAKETGQQRGQMGEQRRVNRTGGNKILFPFLLLSLAFCSPSPHLHFLPSFPLPMFLIFLYHNNMSACKAALMTGSF
jgi:hypothetical protein